MIKYLKYIDESVESNVDFWLIQNAGVLSISLLEVMLKKRFGHIPLRIIDEDRLKKLNRDPKLENRIDGEYVYHKLFDIVEKLGQIYDHAREQGRIKRYGNGGRDFEYAVIDSSEVPEEVHLQAGGYLGSAFSSYQRQWWGKPLPESMANNRFYIFVVGDKIPEEFQEFAALHEYTELWTQLHGEATRSEFQKVAERGNEFLDKYTNWWLLLSKNKLQGLDQENKDALRELLPALSVKILAEKGIL